MIVGIGTLVTVVLIGDSGARTVWGGLLELIAPRARSPDRYAKASTGGQAHTRLRSP